MDVEGRTVRQVHSRANPTVESQAVNLLRDIPTDLYSISLQSYEQQEWDNWSNMAREAPNQCREFLSALAEHCKFPDPERRSGIHDDLRKFTILLSLGRQSREPAFRKLSQELAGELLSIPQSLDRSEVVGSRWGGDGGDC